MLRGAVFVVFDVVSDVLRLRDAAVDRSLDAVGLRGEARRLSRHCALEPVAPGDVGRERGTPLAVDDDLWRVGAEGQELVLFFFSLLIFLLLLMKMIFCKLQKKNKTVTPCRNAKEA